MMKKKNTNTVNFSTWSNEINKKAFFTLFVDQPKCIDNDNDNI